MKKYRVLKVFKNNDKKIVIKDNLTEKEAQKIVQEDIKINPNAEDYMIIYSSK